MKRPTQMTEFDIMMLHATGETMKQRTDRLTGYADWRLPVARWLDALSRLLSHAADAAEARATSYRLAASRVP